MRSETFPRRSGRGVKKMTPSISDEHASIDRIMIGYPAGSVLPLLFLFH